MSKPQRDFTTAYQQQSGNGEDMSDELFGTLDDKLPEAQTQVITEYITDPNALNPQGEGVYIYKRFTMTPVGLDIPTDVSKEEWLDVGGVIRDLDSSISWVVGDWANYAHEKWEVPYEDIAEAFGYEVETLYTYGTVIRAYPTSIRNRGASFGHHRAVIKLPELKQLEWLAKAAKNKWTIAEMKTAIWPKLSSSSTVSTVYDRLFSRERKPNINAFQKLFIRAGQGDTTSREKAIQQIAETRRWLDEYERGLG